MKNISVKTLFLITVFLLFHSIKLFSQSNISARLTSICVNPIDTINNSVYKNKITKNGLLTIEPGLAFSAELFGNDFTSAKLSQTLRLDACSKIAGSTQVLLRFRLLKKWKSTLTAGIGPIYFFRQTWGNVEGYTNEEYFLTSSSTQHAVMWFSGEIEYNLYLSKHADLVVTANHLSPRSFGILIGYKYWFSRKSSKCNTCPSYR
jgi:hypothetical protein